MSIIAYSSLALFSMPVANSQISDITVLYSDTERALSGILAEARQLPFTMERRDVYDRLVAHISLLQTFEKADRLRSKFLGVPVSWGVVKTFFVTLFTLAVGLWSVLKGAGITFTMQSVCPLA